MMRPDVLKTVSNWRKIPEFYSTDWDLAAGAKTLRAPHSQFEHKDTE
jgi:hypothetical protein